MTISLIPADDRFRRFVCTGGETVFPVTFPFFAASDLQVVRLRAGVETVLALATDYTVAGAGSPSGGSVTLLAPALAGDVIAIRGEQPVARTSEWTDGQALTARALNAEHARHTILHQQLLREVSRGLRLSLTEPATTLLLPPQSERASRVLGFDAAGQPVAVVPNAGNLVITPWAETLLDDTSAAAARTTIGFEAAGDARWGRLGAANVWTQPQRVAQELRVDRADFAQEGGRLILRRASDNADAYQLQPFGSGSSPRFRIVKMFGTPAEVLSIEENGAATLAGPLTLPGAPTAASHAATKGYVDSTIDTAVATNVAGASADIATTSGTAFDITGIPSWANQIEVLFFEVSLTTTDHFLIQIGTTSGIETAGYVSVGSNPNASNVTNSTGFVVVGGSAVALVSGCMFLSRMSNSNVWISTHRMYVSANPQGIGDGSGHKTLSGSLDRIRLTRTGAASFDNGSFCVRWRR